MKLIPLIILSLLLWGCSTMKETTTTETKKAEAPARFVVDTQKIFIPLPVTDRVIDSIGRAYLEKFCRGTLETKDNGLDSKLSFYMSQTSRLQDSLHSMILNYQSNVSASAQSVPQEVTTREVVSSPSSLWVFFHSTMFWIPSLGVGCVAGGLIVAKIKNIV